MALSFLEMNEIPKRYQYYQRFIDEKDDKAKDKEIVDSLLNTKNVMMGGTMTTFSSPFNSTQ